MRAKKGKEPRQRLEELLNCKVSMSLLIIFAFNKNSKQCETTVINSESQLHDFDVEEKFLVNDVNRNFYWYYCSVLNTFLSIEIFPMSSESGQLRLNLVFCKCQGNAHMKVMILFYVCLLSILLENITDTLHVKYLLHFFEKINSFEKTNLYESRI